MKNIVSRVIEEIQKGDILTSLTLFILLVCIFYFYNVYFGKVVEGFQYGPWETIKIGSSPTKTKKVGLSKDFMVFDNTPQNKQKSNWRDRFSTRVQGRTLYVTRLDHNSWGQPLELRGRVDNLARIRAATERAKKNAAKKKPGYPCNKPGEKKISFRKVNRNSQKGTSLPRDRAGGRDWQLASNRPANSMRSGYSLTPYVKSGSSVSIRRGRDGISGSVDVDVCIKDISRPKADCSAAEKKAKDAEAQRDSANKKLGIIYGDISRVPPGFDKLKNIPGLEKEITDLENKKKKIEDKRDEFRRLYDKALKRINNPIDGDPSGLNAQIEQLKQSATSAKSQYEKNSAAAEARRLAEIKREQEKAAGAAEVASIKLSEEVAATDSALEQARNAKRKAETERREYMELRKRLEARINQLNAQQGKSNEELFAALDKINELKQISLDERSKMKERIKRERADAVAAERSLMAKSYTRRLQNRMQRFIRRFNLEEERKRQERVMKQREKTQELLSLRRNYLDQYTMDLHDQAKLEKEENMLKQVQRSKTNILTMNKNKENQENEVEPSYTGNNSSQPLMIDGQQNEGKSRITDNRRKQFGIHQSNVYLTVPKDAKKDEVSVGRKTIGGYVFPVSD